MECSQCKSTNLQEDSFNGQDMVVCLDCGGVVERPQFDHDGLDEGPPPAVVRNKLGPSPRSYPRNRALRMSRNAERERKVREALQRMADSARIPEHEVARCEEEGVALVKKGFAGNRWPAKQIAAGLVFIALQRQCHTFSYKEAEELTGIKTKTLCKIVKKLKMQPEVTNPEQPLSPDNKMALLVDRLPVKLDMEEKKQVKRLAVGIQELIEGVKVHGLRTSQNASASCAVLVVALEGATKLKSDDFMDSFAHTMKITPGSLKVRVSRVKNALLQLARKIPSLEQKVEAKEINFRNLSRYVKSILEYRDFILRDPDKPQSTSPGTLCTEGHMTREDYCGYQFDPGEDEGSLSDLDEDISQYIATKSEVEQKLVLMNQPASNTAKS